MKLKYLFYLPLFALSVLASCKGGESKDATAKADSVAKPVIVNEAVALGRIEPEGKIIALASEASGVVTKVFHNEGDSLVAGEAILSINSEVKNAEIALAQSKIATKRSQIAVDQAAINKAKAEINNLKTTYERTLRLFEKGAETKQNADDALTKYQIQADEVIRLEKALNTTIQSVQEMTADVALKNAEKERLTVKAPSNGILLSMEAQAGENVTSGVSFADFAPKGNLIMVCEVDELYANRVNNGALAKIRLQGSLEAIAQGKVIYTAPYLKKKSLFSDAVGDAEDRRVREVKILIEKGDGLLFNSRMEAVIDLKPEAGK